MVTEEQEDLQRAEKVTLKRKLTGPPRLLLLRKTRTRSRRAKTWTDKSKKASGHESLPTRSAAAQSETTELAESLSSEVKVESSRGRCGAVIRNRTVKRGRWWRIFYPAVVCNTKQNKDFKGSSEKQRNDNSVLPEGALEQNNTEENTKRTKGMERFKARARPMFRRFLALSSVRQAHKQNRDLEETDGTEAPITFRKKMQMFFTKEERGRSPGVPQEIMEDKMYLPAAQVDQPAELHKDAAAQSPKVVTVTAEMTVTAETPDKTPEEEQLVCDITEEDLRDAVNTTDTIQTDSEAAEDANNTNNVPVKDKDACDAEDQLPTSSSQQASEADTTSHSLQPVTNGPSIRIELVPPDDILQEDEEEESWEVTSSSEKLLLLLGFEHSEQRLLQTARSLVQAAMKAAVDQLTREQQSHSECVHREPPGCRDHA